MPPLAEQTTIHIHGLWIDPGQGSEMSFGCSHAEMPDLTGTAFGMLEYGQFASDRHTAPPF
jgi:hypothetical protein